MEIDQFFVRIHNRRQHGRDDFKRFGIVTTLRQENRGFRRFRRVFDQPTDRLSGSLNIVRERGGIFGGNRDQRL